MSIKIYSVGEITKIIKDILESNFYGIWVEGEVSSLRYSSTGHLYFSLVDNEASLGVIVYKNRIKNIRFKMENGLKVTVFGSLSLYLKGGEYRIVAEHVRISGSGKKFYDLEKLKEEFKKQGYFDRKRKIPSYSKNIIIITSQTGAAIRDIINILERRGSGMNVYIYPVSVQGEAAKSSILKAFDDINTVDENIDLVILARGGGSNEDLWIFNDPDIAKGLFNLKFPTISAIGHEIDFTLCDFVADMRAETPSAAAELITKSRTESAENLKKLSRLINIQLQKIININKRKLMYFSDKRNLARINGLLNNKILYLDNIEQKLNARMKEKLTKNVSKVQTYLHIITQNAPPNRLKSIKHNIVFFKYKIDKRMLSILDSQRKNLKMYNYKLNSLNPENILKKGYTITTDKNGKVIKSSKTALKQDVIQTRFIDGIIISKIEKD